jgi:leader peptidase (prepilin peptidase) / N-methyltransferase
MVGLYLYVPLYHFLAYAVFFSALIVTIRSDLETMLISRFVTIYLIPLGWIFSFCNLLPITIGTSILGTIIGYAILFGIGKTFYLITRKEGIGQGDLELLAFIGSFLGAMGCWVTLFIGSVVGSILAFGYMIITGNSKATKIPFGPFLAFGAIAYVFLHTILTPLIIP